MRRRDFSQFVGSLPLLVAFPSYAQQAAPDVGNAAKASVSCPVSLDDNPLLQAWNTPFGLPPFEKISTTHFQPAFAKAMAEHNSEIAAVLNETAPATFENTIAALERSGHTIDRVYRVFSTLTQTNSTPDLLSVERSLAPVLADHYSAIALNNRLFHRVEAVRNDRAKLSLSEEQNRTLDLVYEDFIRYGAQLAGDQRKRFEAIGGRLATLGVQFAQNVLADEANWLLLLERKDLDGLPQWWLDAARRTASDRGHPEKWAVTLSRSNVEPFLTYSARRDLRAKAFAAWTNRGERGGPTDNRAIITEIIRLRSESARMLGFDNFAQLKLSNQMAKTPERVRALMDIVWAPAKAAAAKELDELQRIARAEGSSVAIEAADWRYYTNKARRARFNFTEDQLRSYLSLDVVIGATFEIANKLFGLSFVERKDLKLHHPDARAFEVRDQRGRHLAIFVGDYFARPEKRGGAWMSSLRPQTTMDGTDVRPIVFNVLNFSRGGEGQKTLLGLDDARTLFHEFGHALQGILSDVGYPTLYGPNGARDFVEFHSQLYERWFLAPKKIEHYARNAQTGSRVPEALVRQVRATEKFNQGFLTVEYCASALVDLELHLLAPGPEFDATAFERETLSRIGMPKEIAMRHRAPHFTHIFSSDNYAAGYYAYLWSAVLADDAFEAFVETNDVFDKATAERLERYLYAAGQRKPPQQAYRAFRGHAPDLNALLRTRGFDFRTE
jgi:peptidyl-dipeptidase Dcp